MMKLILLISALVSLNAVASNHSGKRAKPAAKTRSGGVVYICSDRSGEIKMTADLAAQVGEKLAIVAEIGSKEIFPERVNGKAKHTFVIRPSKTALFELKKVGSKQAILRLNIDPENTHAVVAQDQEGVKIVKMDAFLDAPSIELYQEPMSCLETSWQ